jgi:protocatechuate 3,4-dioxygenase, alpha subunit
VRQTASQTVGPYLLIGLIRGGGQNDLVQAETAGERIKITGIVYDGSDEPVTDGMVEIWQADANGIFNHPSDPLREGADPHFRGFGRSATVDGGIFTFHTVKPGGRDGSAPHVNVHVFARGLLLHVMTRIYFEDEAANEADPVLGTIEAERRPTLIAIREESEGVPTYCFDIRLQGERETVFFDPA